MIKTKVRIAFLVSYSGDGGVEVVTSHLVDGLVEQGYELELLLIKNRGKHLKKLSSRVKQTKLNASSAWLCLPQLLRYLKHQPPDVLFAIKDRACQVAAVAKKLSGYKGLSIGQIHNNMITGLDNRNAIAVKLRYSMMKVLYPIHDKIVTVSPDSAKAIQKITGMPGDKVIDLANPVITRDMMLKAQQPARHPWFENKETPTLVAMGRLVPQKNFSNLLQALARVIQQLQCRLVIFGEGGLRGALQQEITELKLEHCVDMPGHVENPLAEIKHADLFVLSSGWEGSPTVLTECLSLGIPCVATRVGDTHITLQEGKVGALVEPDNPEQLAEAIVRQLRTRYDAEALRSAVRKFTQENSVAAYSELLMSLLNKA